MHSGRHSFIHSGIHSFRHSGRHSFIQAFRHSGIHLFRHSGRHSGIYSFSYSFRHSLRHSNSQAFKQSDIHSGMQTFRHSFKHSSIHPGTEASFYVSIHWILVYYRKILFLISVTIKGEVTYKADIFSIVTLNCVTCSKCLTLLSSYTQEPYLRRQLWLSKGKCLMLKSQEACTWVCGIQITSPVGYARASLEKSRVAPPLPLKNEWLLVYW